jgi:BirA family transcriptional regulator, biotin operon repressor / biotin---[acetyl-CoA-carboxylase] ligase
MEVIRHHFVQLDSTNTWAKQNAYQFDPNHITLVTAHEQTAGRGRFKRLWISPPGENIYATFCFFLEHRLDEIGNIPQILALSAAQLLEKLGFPAKIKWPNDVLMDGKKIAGILCETTSPHDLLCIILGIGLNVNMPQETIQTIDRPAISLFAFDGFKRDYEEVLIELQNIFTQNLALFLKEGFKPFLSPFLQLIIHREGEQMRFHDNGIIREGIYKGINPNGTLTLLISNGEERIFFAGEIRPLV